MARRSTKPPLVPLPGQRPIRHVHCATCKRRWAYAVGDKKPWSGPICDLCTAKKRNAAKRPRRDDL